MSRSLLFVPLFVLLICCACQPVYGREVNKSKGIAIFDSKTATVMEYTGVRALNYFRVPHLVDVGGVMVALAQGSDADGNVHLVEAHLEPSRGDASATLSQKFEQMNVTRRFVLMRNQVGRRKREIAMPKLFGNDSKVIAYIRTLHCVETHDHTEPVYQLAVGEVGGNSKEIKWDNVELLSHTVTGLFRNDGANSLLGDAGSGIMVKNALVIPVSYKDGASSTVSGIIYSAKNELDTKWVFENNSLSKDCIYPAVVEWEGKLIMMTSCKDGYRKVHESTDMGKTWTESFGTLSRVWGNTESRTGMGARGDFTTATIDNRTVMLFVQPVISENHALRQLRLWMTDGTHIYNADVISHEEENATAGSILYKDDKLYCLYEVNESGTNNIVLAELPNELRRMKRALRTWIKLETNFSQPCGSDGAESGASSGKCAFPISTVGLVGLLSNRSDDNYWKEEYRCVRANVCGGTKVANGMRFQGVGAGAQWPVGKQGQDQRYNFANHAFTLAASVAFHAVPSADTPVLGASLERNAKRDQGADDVSGLSITPDKRWKISTTDNCSDALPSLGEWKLHRTYHVALMMQKGTGSLYINGKSVWNDTEHAFFDMVQSGIWQFHIGGYGDNKTDTKTYMTAANVFLYNRTLNADEVKALFKNRVIIPRLGSAKRLLQNSTKSPSIVPRAAATMVSEASPEPSLKTAPHGDDTYDELLYCGVTSQNNDLPVRKEAKVPRDTLEKMKLGLSRPGKGGDFLPQGENVDVTVRERVGGVSFLLLGLAVFLWAN